VLDELLALIYRRMSEHPNESLAHSIDKVMAEEIKAITPQEALRKEAEALERLAAIYHAIAVGAGAPLSTTTLAQAKVEQTGRDTSYVHLPLTLAIPAYLADCKEPQTAKQIASALVQAGRDFETAKPVHSVQTALRKAMIANSDVFHATWCKWWLKSKCTKAQLEKYLAKNARFGTGGHTKKEHAKRTSDGIAKRRSQGLRWGPKPKATPELLERAKQMMRDGVSLSETCRQLDVAIPTLYQFGIRQRDLQKEGELQRQKAKQEAAADASADVIPLHGRTGSAS